VKDQSELLEMKSRIKSMIQDKWGMTPSIIELVAPGTLPRTSSGKIKRVEAVKRFKNGTLSKKSGFKNIIFTNWMLIQGKLYATFFRKLINK